jgi:hypothetical protein
VTYDIVCGKNPDDIVVAIEANVVVATGLIEGAAFGPRQNNPFFDTSNFFIFFASRMRGPCLSIYLVTVEKQPPNLGCGGGLCTRPAKLAGINRLGKPPNR